MILILIALLFLFHSWHHVNCISSWCTPPLLNRVSKNRPISFQTLILWPLSVSPINVLHITFLWGQGYAPSLPVYRMFSAYTLPGIILHNAQGRIIPGNIMSITISPETKMTKNFVWSIPAVGKRKSHNEQMHDVSSL